MIDKNATSSNHLWSLDLSADFSKYLIVKQEENKPHLKMTYYAERQNNKDSATGNSVEFGQAITMLFGYSF